MAVGVGGPPGCTTRGGHDPSRPCPRESRCENWARPPYDVVWFSTANSVRMDRAAKPRSGRRGSDGSRGRQGGAPGRTDGRSAAIAAVREPPCAPGSSLPGPAQRLRLAPISAIARSSGGAGGGTERPGRCKIRSTQRQRDTKHLPATAAAGGKPGRRRAASRALAREFRLPTQHRRCAVASDRDRSSHPGSRSRRQRCDSWAVRART